MRSAGRVTHWRPGCASVLAEARTATIARGLRVRRSLTGGPEHCRRSDRRAGRRCGLLRRLVHHPDHRGGPGQSDLGLGWGFPVVFALVVAIVIAGAAAETDGYFHRGWRAMARLSAGHEGLICNWRKPTGSGCCRARRVPESAVRRRRRRSARETLREAVALRRALGRRERVGQGTRRLLRPDPGRSRLVRLEQRIQRRRIRRRDRRADQFGAGSRSTGRTPTSSWSGSGGGSFSGGSFGGRFLPGGGGGGGGGGGR